MSKTLSYYGMDGGSINAQISSQITTLNFLTHVNLHIIKKKPKNNTFSKN